MKKVRFIYNPASGETAVAERIDQIVRIYQSYGFILSLYRLTFDGDSETGILDGLDDTFDHVLIAGGDGTINYVINLLKKAGVEIPVGVLPTGTANDFASALGISSDVETACRAMLGGKVRRIDLGRVNGEYFVNVFSCGLFTEISQKTPTVMKNTFGRLAYYMSGIGEIGKIRKMNLSIRTDRCDFEGSALVFFVFNGKTAGQLKLAYLSELDDGLLDLIIVKGDNTLETARTIFQYFFLIGQASLPRKPKAYPPGVIHIRCSRLEASIDTSESTDMDGQPGPGFPLAITCEAGALPVLLPDASKNPVRRNARLRR